jgi:isopentenyl-diphosphate delta-isomerase
MQVEYVILVNDKDQPLGAMEKMEAHEKGVMHRAFSVFIFNSSGQLLLQRRALEKYHSPGLWSNTVCSHPRTGEQTIDAAHRRMVEEMGFDCDLQKAFDFTYRANVGGGLIEHEFDHVFTGTCDTTPVPNPDEVVDWKYVSMDWVVKDVERHPENYTVWFIIALAEVRKHLAKSSL